MTERMRLYRKTHIERIVHAILCLSLVVPLLLCTGEEVYAQRKRGDPAKRETERRSDDIRTRFPDRHRDDEPFADLAAEVIRDLASPKTGVKRAEFQPATLLSPAQLSGITRYQREGSRIPPRPYASVAEQVVNQGPIYAEGSVGLYGTARLRAGITQRFWPYDYRVRLAAGTTRGPVSNATRSDVSLNAIGGYVINDNAWIFSGGHMDVEVCYARRDYLLYSLPSHPDRSIESWHIAMSGANTYLNDEFSLQGRYRGLTLNDDGAGTYREHALEGTASFGTPWMGLVVGGDATLSLASLNGASMPYTRAAGRVTYRRRVVTLTAGGAVSTGENDDGSVVARIVPTARIAITPADGFAIAGNLTGGVQQWQGDQVLTANPWGIVVATPNARHEDQMIGYSVELRLDPSDAFNLHLSATHSPYADYLGYTTPAEGRFIPLYQPTTVDQIAGETMIGFDDSNLFTGVVRFAETTLDRSGRRLPFTPRWFVEAMHSTGIAPLPLSVILGARYLGDRSDASGGVMADVVLVSLEGRYRLSRLLELTVAMTNLLDTDYELWTGYRERGFYASIGLALRY